ncbi:MAG: histone deacetylase [bacterium]|nr:histone deacetylase [bacterium]
MNRRVCGLLADERFLMHETGAHLETPARLRALYDMLDREGLRARMVGIEARRATIEELALNHTLSYIEMLERMGAGSLDADTVVSAGSHETALLAAGGCLNMVDAVMEGDISSGLALVRPPGHHAESGRGMGFCLFNNIAIAARHLIGRHGAKRVAILDWDLHHGNGTQHSFYGEKEVLYISLHQSPCYPGTGMLTETGEGDGEGFTLNLPIPQGVGDRGYVRAFKELFIPAMTAYGPDIILVSAGFDSHRFDPLGGMEVSAGGFGEMTRLLMNRADDLCGGKIAFFLEGGYSLDGLAESVKEVALGMLGEKEASPVVLTEGVGIDSVLEAAKMIHGKYIGNF